MSCRGSPVPLSKSAGTKQLKVVHGASATCVLQNAFSGLLGAPGILGPGKIGTFYQRIAPEAPTQSLRELLSARQDLGPSAKDCLLIYQHQENGRTDFLQNDNLPAALYNSRC